MMPLVQGLRFAGALLFAIALPALAHDDGRYANSPLKPWFDQLKSDKGLCCSFIDGISIPEVDWDNLGPIDDINSGYRVHLGGQWINVPKSAVIQEPNRDGRAIVWPYTGNGGETEIRCFLRGSGV